MSQNPSLSPSLSQREENSKRTHNIGWREKQSKLYAFSLPFSSWMFSIPSSYHVQMRERHVKHRHNGSDGILIVQHWKYRFTKGSHRVISSRRYWAYVRFSQQHTKVRKVLEFCVNDSKFPARLFCFSYYFSLLKSLVFCLFVFTHFLAVGGVAGSKAQQRCTVWIIFRVTSVGILDIARIALIDGSITLARAHFGGRF